ncbi:porin [Skermanella sp. TT6]|uniref:Porin n=1 Tax=Skermanella cutis TaxID=2775420 RepID=A0ABX7B8L2_9PROT|nr:porin [Skermanella sp. TT6]QQP89658.1 porin [Skermanella sp. TT6]
MRNILLATTALAAVAGFASAANAQIKVTLGGYTEFFAAIYDNSLINGTDREFQLETEIVVRADGKADNGLLYGAKIELQNGVPTAGTTGVGTDEASVYLGGSWGRLELGDFDGAADTLAIFAPLTGVEALDGDGIDFLAVTGVSFAGKTGTFELGRTPWGAAIKAPDSGDATKIMYLTPRFMGFQAGFSYAPENGDEAQNVITTKNSRDYSDFLEFGINYVNTFDGVSVSASATGTSGNGKGNTFTSTTTPARTGTAVVNGVEVPVNLPAVTTTTTNPALKNFTAWQLGAQVGYAGFKFGGSYIDADDFNVPVGTNSGDQHAWNVGATYTTGPATVGLFYSDSEGYKRAPGTYADSYELYGISGTYVLAPGFLIQSDLLYLEEDLKTSAAATAAANKVSTDGYVWVVSTRLNF